MQDTQLTLPGIPEEELYQRPERIAKSLCDSQDEILDAIQNLHCPWGYECDLTYGNGNFWRRRPRPKLCFDIEPLRPWVSKAHSGSIPLPDSCLRSAVFDPPFMTYVRNGREHKEGKVAMTRRFGGYWTVFELLNHYEESIQEASRLLIQGGILVVKNQDIVHNHRLHCTHHHTISMAQDHGFQVRDLFILGANYRMPSPQRGVQRHARIHHSFFIVFERR